MVPVGLAFYAAPLMRFPTIANRLILLLLACALLSACSAVRVVYNQADTLLSWMAHDYFDLEPLQKQDFNTRLDALLIWHRHEQLPEYVRFLGEIKQRMERTATRDDALWLIDGAKARYRTIAAKGTPDAVEMLAALTPDNIKALQKQFDKDNRKFATEYKLDGTAEARRRARLDRTLKRIRDWTGPLSPAQEARITALNDTIPYTDHLRQQDRQRRQKEFLAMLNTRANKADFARTLRPWLADWESGRPAAMQTALDEGYEKRIVLYLEVERSLTPQQRTHVQQRLQGYIDDLNALVAKRAVVN
jgi:Family of unknown function (DUF6279)